MRRTRMIVAGVVLGSTAVAILMMLGALGLRPHREPAPPAGPVVASLPELHTALLDGPDLPASFAPSPTGTAGPSAHEPRPLERCQELIADPSDLLNWMFPQTTANQAGAHYLQPDHSTLDQALRVFDGDQASHAFDTLRQTAKSCHNFTAKLPDGTQAKVHLAAGKTGNLLVGDAYTVDLSMTTPAGPRFGYVAVGRVGDVLSVLRSVSPGTTADLTSALDGEVNALLDRALNKIVPFAQLTLASPPADIAPPVTDTRPPSGSANSGHFGRA